jgi:hypothetical protein
MSNIFTEVLQDATGVEEKLLGPTYPYYSNIKTPKEIGMSDQGSIQAMGKDINGLVQYVSLLVSGKSEASATGGPLGNKFFLQTGAKCKDVATEDEQDRYIYVNNVPEGNIPFISQGMGVNFSEFRGLIPGTMGNLNVLNPYAIMGSFMAGSTPDCQELTMETIDNNNNKSSETHFVTLVDIQNMDPCIFPNRSNPITGARCRETFQSINSNSFANTYAKYTPSTNLPSDPLIQLYLFLLMAVMVYLIFVKKK